jgi:DMSO/TMAO reductase YedYZ molybdopterin-dependent catalytic subunit
LIQHVAGAVVTPIMKLLFDGAAPQAEFPRDQISPFFWPNGKMPTSVEWTSLKDGGFKDYRLKVSGLVETPVELSLDEIRALGEKSQVTLHHCIQGWSGVAAWRGTPVSALLDRVRPSPEARKAVFHSFGEGLEGGSYYDSHTIDDLRHAQSILAYEMNGEPLSALHGAPLRLRVESQLGFKMVKWISAIEFVQSDKDFGEGEGGYNEDHEYFGERAPI